MLTDFSGNCFNFGTTMVDAAYAVAAVAAAPPAKRYGNTGSTKDVPTSDAAKVTIAGSNQDGMFLDPGGGGFTNTDVTRVVWLDSDRGSPGLVLGGAAFNTLLEEKKGVCGEHTTVTRSPILAGRSGVNVPNLNVLCWPDGVSTTAIWTAPVAGERNIPVCLAIETTQFSSETSDSDAMEMSVPLNSSYSYLVYESATALTPSCG